MNRLTAKKYDKISYLGGYAIIAHIYDNGTLIIEPDKPIGDEWYIHDSDALKGYIPSLSNTFLTITFGSIKDPLTDYQKELHQAIEECKSTVQVLKLKDKKKKEDLPF